MTTMPATLSQESQFVMTVRGSKEELIWLEEAS